MYEDYLHLENIWTKGNAGLPLSRYLGCKFRLYQSDFADYVFYYDHCWPMVATEHTHADCAPSRMLTKKTKIIIPSRLTQQRKKPYKKSLYNHLHKCIANGIFKKKYVQPLC